MLDEYLKSKSEFIEQKLIEFIPKIIDYKWMSKNFSNNFSDTEIINEIMNPIWNLMDRGGKRWRPIFMILCCGAVGGGSKIVDLIPIVEIIHNGTLIIDDIEDNSDLRRGKPTIHKLYGIDVAVNTGNLMYFLPFFILKDIDLDKKTKLGIYEIIFEEMLNLHIGQGMDIYWHSGGDIVSEELYLKMCAFKTGTLARMSAKIGAILGDGKKTQVKALAKFAENIGVAFQIKDDILNITNSDWGKELGEDITEGKRSLMVIYTLNNANSEDKLELNKILGLKTKDPAIIKKAINILKKYDSINYAKNIAEELVKDSWNTLDRYIIESESKDKLKLFAEYLIERKF
jgi:geranylgeranyl pyrophosphate synthase